MAAQSDATYTERTPRVIAARKLHRRADRAANGRFLAEGVQAVREAVQAAAGLRELFVTAEAGRRHPELVAAAERRGARISLVTERAAAALSDTVTPQGIVAVCDVLTVEPDAALAGHPRLVAVLAEVSDPGNAGTVIRVADAAGADAVILAGNAVDPHNGKCVRASAGSIFHLPIAVSGSVAAAVAACRGAGMQVLAAAANGRLDLDDAADRGVLDAPTAWLFGSEAHGLDPVVLTAADGTVRVPIHGRAESLNLATAAAVCLYASARHATPAVMRSSPAEAAE